MKRHNKLKIFSLCLALTFILQLMPLESVFAVGGSKANLTGTGYLKVHSTDTAAWPLGQASSLSITQANGTTPISPDLNGVYNDIPAGAKISLNYAFSLEDGDGTNFYKYDDGDYFTATLPNNINFTTTPSTIVATDSSSGLNYNLANWIISGNTLTVTLTGEASSHQNMWGVIHIDGTFSALNDGDPTQQIITFGSTTITINRQPLPTKSTLAKSGAYDASKNEITWTVNVNPPSSSTAYDGYSIIDKYGANQSYVADSFNVGTTAVPDTSLTIDSSNRTITYTFPDTTPDTKGTQTITYKTAPTDFSAETGLSAGAEYSAYDNTVDLMRGTDTAADEANSSVRLDWINKTGTMVDTNAADPTIAKWTVYVTVPGTSGKSITNAVIEDTITSGLELFTDLTHPVSIDLGTGASPVSSGTTDGTYSYSGNLLTYTFPTSSQPTAGTTATLTYYTHVTTAAWSTYLNNNSGVSFSNSAKLSWHENTTSTYPSDSYTISNGIGAGGLLSKSADSAANYSYSVSDPGTIHWTITVNHNKINIVNAKLTDLIPSDQLLLIEPGHPLTVTKIGTAPALETITSAASTSNFTYNDPNHFSYEFPEEIATDTITSAYTVDYYTRLVDSSGLVSLYSNGTIPFTNGVTLTRNSGATVSTSGTKNYYSQMVYKSVITQYNYVDRTVQWQIVVNRNHLLLTNGVLTDTLPTTTTDGVTTGMPLYINGASYPFTVTSTGSDTGSLSAFDGGSSFTLTLPSSTTDEFTLTFWTKMTEETLKTQWSGAEVFSNKADLTAGEISGKLSSSDSVSVTNPVVSKTSNYTAGDDTIYWSVIINPAQVALNNAVVTDALNSSLKLDSDSVALYPVTINSLDGSVAATGAAVTKTDYIVILPSTANANTLSVSLPASTKLAYKLTFSTFIAANSINLTNSVSLSGTAGGASGSASSDHVVVNNLYSIGGSGTNKLTVHKTDKDGNPLSGATFTLLNASQQPVKDGNGNIITAITNSSGDALFDKLPSWVFYVQETDPTPGYLIPPSPIFGDGSRLNVSEIISVTDYFALMDVSFSKLGAGGVALSGGLFTLTGTDYAGNSVTKTASAADGTAGTVAGKVTFKDVPLNLSGTHYTITETLPPDGHEASSTLLSASVAYNTAKDALVTAVTPGTLVDTPLKGSVSFTKTGMGGAKLSGGSFTLSGIDYNGNPVTIPGASADLNGEVKFSNVPIGSYTITEDAPPSGYLKPASSAILTATVAYNAGFTGVETTINRTSSGTPTVSSYSNSQALGTLSFSKLDSRDSALLSGGTFILSGNDFAGNAVSITSSSIGGTVTFTGVPLGDNYTITEASAPAGYLVNSTPLTASVKYSADKTSVVTAISSDKLTDTLAPMTLTGEIYILKTDSSGLKLAGAEFTLYTGSGSTIATTVSDASGLAVFNHVPFGSAYVVKETKAPSGYDINPVPISVSIGDTLKHTFTVIDTKQASQTGSISILKTDGNGKILAGAVFTLYDGNGTSFGSVVTQADGKAKFSDVPAGNYTLKETTAPSGYVLYAITVSLTVKSGDALSYTFKNDKAGVPSDSGKATGKLQLAKVDENHNPLAGAQFTLFDKDGNVITTAVSGSDGMVIFDGLKPGDYSVKETAAPTGYSLFSDSLAFQIQSAGDVKSYTLQNQKLTEAQGVAGWSDSGNISGGKPASKLPQTGGIPASLYLLLAGTFLILTGLFSGKAAKHKLRSQSKAKRV